MRAAPVLSLAVLTLLLPSTSAAQSAIRDELLAQFDASAGKLVALARAMPASTYGWRPMEGVASVADVYMHIARYNYYYPDEALGVAPPAGVDYESWEGQITDKERAVDVLERSLEHVRSTVSAMSGAELAVTTHLYGRDVERWAVMLQLVAHMNEHLGQSIAYARMNRVTPPWSR